MQLREKERYNREMRDYKKKQDTQDAGANEKVVGKKRPAHSPAKAPSKSKSAEKKQVKAQAKPPKAPAKPSAKKETVGAAAAGGHHEENKEEKKESHEPNPKAEELKA